MPHVNGSGIVSANLFLCMSVYFWVTQYFTQYLLVSKCLYFNEYNDFIALSYFSLSFFLSFYIYSYIYTYVCVDTMENPLASLGPLTLFKTGKTKINKQSAPVFSYVQTNSRSLFWRKFVYFFIKFLKKKYAFKVCIFLLLIALNFPWVSRYLLREPKSLFL